jgi:hypothetical protein
MRRWGWTVAAALAVGWAGAAAAADTPGLSNKVYDPYVRNGVIELELRGGRLTGGPLNGEQAAVVELERGINDRLSLAVVGEFEQHAGEARKLDSIGIEGVVYIGQIPGLGVDVGGYLEYEQRLHNESGVVEAKLLLAKRSGRFETRFNLIGRTPLTDRPGEGDTDLGYAAQATVDATRGLKLGAQAFGALGTTGSLGGRQGHYLGPVANWEFRPAWMQGGEVELEAAYLLPAGTARADSDGQVRLMLEFERRF